MSDYWEIILQVCRERFGGVEEATGMDFFGTMPEEEQDRLESALDLRAWGIGGR